MKNILALISVLISVNCTAQTENCSRYITEKIDKITGDSLLQGKTMVAVTKNAGPACSISTFYKKGDPDIFVTIKALKGITCVDENEKIYFVFTDGSRQWSYGRQLYNCQGQFSLLFGETYGYILLDSLKSKAIKSIRLESKTGVIDFDLPQVQGIQFMNQLACLDSFLLRKPR